eukprot:271934-Prorocentrum_minimum.AAC.1
MSAPHQRRAGTAGRHTPQLCPKLECCAPLGTDAPYTRITLQHRPPPPEGGVLLCGRQRTVQRQHATAGGQRILQLALRPADLPGPGQEHEHVSLRVIGQRRPHRRHHRPLHLHCQVQSHSRAIAQSRYSRERTGEAQTAQAAAVNTYLYWGSIRLYVLNGQFRSLRVLPQKSPCSTRAGVQSQYCRGVPL